MISSFLVLMAIAPLWSKPVSSDCVLTANHKGNRILMACRSDDGLRISVVTPDGRIAAIEKVDRDALRGVVDTGSASWSPADRFVALEIGFNEEPGVLLIDTDDPPSVLLVDRAMARLNVSVTQPQWNASGEWLLFRTSGTGERPNEGIYALQIKEGSIFKLVTGLPRSFTLANNTVLLSRVVATDSPKTELVAFRFDPSVRQNTPVATVVSGQRKRNEKE